MLVEQVDELALLCGAGIWHLMGDEDRAQARDGQRPRVEARLEIINVLNVRHGDEIGIDQTASRGRRNVCGRFLSLLSLVGDERLLMTKVYRTLIGAGNLSNVSSNRRAFVRQHGQANYLLAVGGVALQ